MNTLNNFKKSLNNSLELLTIYLNKETVDVEMVEVLKRILDENMDVYVKVTKGETLTSIEHNTVFAINEVYGKEEA